MGGATGVGVTVVPTEGSVVDTVPGRTYGRADGF